MFVFIYLFMACCVMVIKCVVRLSHKPRHTGCQTNVYSIFKSWHNVHLFSSKAVIYHKHFSSLLTHSHDTVEQSQLCRIYSQLKASIFIILYFGDVCMHVTGFTLARGRDTSNTVQDSMCPPGVVLHHPLVGATCLNVCSV